MSTSRTLPALVAVSLLLAPALSAQVVFEDFEMLPGPPGGSLGLGTAILDENSTVLGQGPGLLQDGCSYYSDSAGLYLYGANYFGTPSVCIASSAFGNLVLDYDIPVDWVEFELFVATGFPDTIDVRAYNSNGVLLSTQSGVSLSGSGAPAVINFSATGIAKIEVGSNTYHWTPFLDNHSFGDPPAGVPTLTILGVCGQQLSGARVTNMSPNSLVGFAISPSNAGSWALPVSGCFFVNVGLGSPIRTLGIRPTNSNGEATVMLSGGIPASVCGWYAQAIDYGSCTLTNVATL